MFRYLSYSSRIYAPVELQTFQEGVFEGPLVAGLNGKKGKGMTPINHHRVGFLYSGIPRFIPCLTPCISRTDRELFQDIPL